MSSRKLAGYRDVVSRPGKFQGEEPWVPYYYEAFLHGLADDDDGEIMYFRVTPEDRGLFPALEVGALVCLEERSDGFVTGWISEPIE